MTEIFKQLMKKRGLDESFLHPKYEDLDDPFLLPDMEKALVRLEKARENREKVIVYGDYDVDGVTASAEMIEILQIIGVERVEVMLPNRFTDGYGMSERVIERAKQTGATLVMTVDCGSNNGEIIAELAENGVDTIVTDHHELQGEVPKEAVAVINPKREDFRKAILQRQAEILEKGEGKDFSSLSELCGAGVVFMLARAMVEKGWIKDGQEKWLLDLVAIGTVCDTMKLIGNNRIICYYGLIVLKKTRRPGLKELMKVAKMREINTEALGFQIGPRLNAAGRMETAETALKLLTTKSSPEAAKIAKELNKLNEERRRQQEEATRGIQEKGVGDEKVLVVEGPWHEGVLGIIAGRLVELYKRPCFVISSENGKGSGRSFGDFNLALALAECQETIEKGGGHAEACGLKLKTGMVNEFRKAVNKYYNSLKLRDQERYLLKNEDLKIRELKDLNLNLIEDLELLEPFGTGNPEPVFLAEKMVVSQVRRMGTSSQHLSVIVSQKERIFRLVAFNAPEEWMNLQIGEKADVWFTPVVNDWHGDKTVEGRLLRVEVAPDQF